MSSQMTSKGGPVAAVTGANGYVGSIVVEGLAEAGFDVRRLVRSPDLSAGDHYYDIAVGCSEDALADVDVLVHCAYDFSVTSRKAIWETNVYGTRTLLDQAVSAGVRRTIFVSSMSAYTGTRQIYGRAKLACEADVFSRGMCAIRPGLIYGPRWGGMAGTLRKLASLPIVPLIFPRTHQFVLHESDLLASVVTLARAKALASRPLGLAHPDPVEFDELLTTFAGGGPADTPRFVPVPWQPLYWAIRSAELATVPLPVRADSLLGLVRPAPSVPGADDLKELGITFRPFGA
jgi:nucleoside-diphosphate-sugar epimerase